jgi:glycosyltransferase involved in cell wall biosynthesis
LLQRVERELLHRAAYVSTTSHALSVAMQNAYGGARPIVISNSFPLQPVPPPLPRQQPLGFFWFSQTIGPGRGLELLIAAWRRTTQPSRLCLLGDVSGEYRAKLLGRLPPERRAQLEFLPIVAPKELPVVIARHDIGLALEHNRPPSRHLTITNKILQYLNAGLAVVASDTAGHREVMAHAPGAGFIANLAETGELANRLDTLLAQPTRLAAMGAAARRAAEETYCWEKEEPRLVAAVEAALRPSPAGSAHFGSIR